MQMMCAYEVRRFPPTHDLLSDRKSPRLLLSGIPSSASSSLLKSGRDLITRKDPQNYTLLSIPLNSPYSLDLYFWYDSAFGSPFGKILGIGYVQELVARLTQTPIPAVSLNVPIQFLILIMYMVTA